MFGLPEKKPEQALKILSESGFTHLSLPRNNNLIKLALDYGFKVYVFCKTFGLENKFRRAEYLAEDIYGRKYIWFGSGCPNNLELRQKNLEWIEDTATQVDISGISLDGIRFSSPGSGIEAFFTCFCETCRRKAEDLGYDFEKMRGDLQRLYESFEKPKFLKYVSSAVEDPLMLLDFLTDFRGVVEWLSFRADCIAEHVRDARNLLKSIDPELELGAYIFTPSLSSLVGQDYRMLSLYLDVLQPMIYRLGKGVACYNHELAVLAEDLSRLTSLPLSNTLSLVYKLAGVSEFNPPLDLNKLKESGLPLEIVSKEALRAQQIALGKRVEPIIMLRDPQVEDATRKVLSAGCSGVNFFIYKEGFEDKIRKIGEVVRES
ncbi:MAG: hypothetical protein DRJ52_07405 [Thermoprotei archaeon]|nr:MAG: hypothetical protein DRJ52_07405 [Thermoprotei archaeon]RLE99764.1 MAG: hypothetical protein DRJ63_04425 [Thermoprotei archaeon]